MSQPNPTPVESASPLPPPARRRRWVTPLLAFVLFASGVVTGAGSAVFFARHEILYALHHPEKAPARIMPILRRRLNLSEDQSSQVRQILVRRQAALQDIRREVQPRVEAELDALEKEIAGVLDENQKVKWHRRLADLRETWIPPALPPPSSQTLHPTTTDR